MVRRILVSAFFILVVSLTLYPEEKRQAETGMEKASIESVEISPNPVGRGDVFTMTITVDHDSSYDVEFPLEDLPGDYALWRGPYIRSFIDTDKSGVSKRKVRIITSFKAGKSGRQIFPSLTVTVGKKRLLTEPVLLRVGLYRNRQLYLPLEVEWVPAFDVIYAGEAVPLFLTVKNQEIVSLFGSVRVETPRDVFFEKAQGIGSIAMKATGDIVLYDIPAAAYLFTSPIPGEIRIPAAGVDSEDITGWADSLSLQIKAVPEEIKTTGAVGKFNFNSSVDTGSVSVGQEFEVVCTVSGEGNLNYLKIPEPSVSGCIQLSEEESRSYTQSMNGYTGTKEMRWRYTAEGSGTAIIKIPPFPWFDKSGGVIQTATEKEHRITVKPAESSPAFEKEDVFPFDKITDESKGNAGWKNLYKNPVKYIWLLPGFILFAVVRIFKTRRFLISLVISAVIIVAIFSLSNAFFRDDSPRNENASDAVTHYNLGLEYYLAGSIGPGIHNIRTAVYLEPTQKIYRDALAWIDQHEGFLNQVSPSVKMHPDMFYYSLIGAVNLMFLVLLLRYKKPGGPTAVASIMASMLVFLSVIMMVFSIYSRNQPVGTVSGGEIHLRKIPREIAETWLPVPEGTAVRVLDESDGFRLIETGTGITGWLERSYILYDRADCYGDE